MAKRKIENIEPNEVSLVSKPANRIKFLLVKSEQGFESLLSEIFKDGDGYGYGELSDDTKKEVQAAIETLKKYQGDLPDDLAEAIKTLIAAGAATGITGDIEKADTATDSFPSLGIDRTGRLHRLSEEGEE
jgi:hypothetical protein